MRAAAIEYDLWLRLREPSQPIPRRAWKGWERPRCMTERYVRKRDLTPPVGMNRGTRNARLRARRKARGACVDCARPAVAGQTRCQHHRDKQSRYRREHTIKRAPWYQAIHGAPT